jgi:hypothetical protein
MSEFARLHCTVDADGLATIHAPHGTDMAALERVAAEMKMFAAVDAVHIEFYDAICCNETSEFETVH